MSRPTWDEYFASVAELASRRSTCNRAQVGCVLVRGNRIISTGYNGSASGTPHCTEEGCIIKEGHCVRSIHAEVNAVGQAARSGVSTEGAIAFVTHTPCASCLQVLSSAGVNEAVILERYGDPPTEDVVYKVYDTRIKYLEKGNE